MSPTEPMTLTPGVTYTAILTAHLPPTTDATIDAVLAEGNTTAPDRARWVVNGQVEVTDGQRVFPRNLSVTDVICPQVTPPAINWRPPVTNMRIAPGQVATPVVTMTSAMTIENASLKVTGAITPYLTVDFGEAPPFTVLPNISTRSR